MDLVNLDLSIELSVAILFMIAGLSLILVHNNLLRLAFFDNGSGNGRS